MLTGTITRFLVEKSKMEMTTGYFLKNEQDQENKLNICIKNNLRDWSYVLIIDKDSFYFLSPEKYKWVESWNYSEKKDKVLKKFIFRGHLVIKVFLSFKFSLPICIHLKLLV